ncbi:cell division initiation protein [Pontibacter ummariensis]|uniref:Cell division initiation protein n=1 Tax=Pontibacter ummariensis TaxID=1610492 RepID=A0A239BF21_9BACT|nr:DivIVA domain-containing protein [Pontibacter ummariensis]PRY16465.1 cell division initiation protein [Pontibacter ummariensis]SNS05643.1 cell division initiation protein [Pontibacter ummariensis]
MKITPLEIRQKTFEKAFRGLDKDEVNAFLLTLSQQWEKLLDENKDLRMKLDAAHRETQKLREVESSLYKTLKTAEDTGSSIVEQANKSAELKVREAELKAEQVLNQARNEARQVLEEAMKQSEKVVAQMQQEVKVLEQDYQRMESYLDTMVRDLRNLANEALEKAEKTSAKPKAGTKSILSRAADVKVESGELLKSLKDMTTTTNNHTSPQLPEPTIASAPAVAAISPDPFGDPAPDVTQPQPEVPSPAEPMVPGVPSPEIEQPEPDYPGRIPGPGIEQPIPDVEPVQPDKPEIQPPLTEPSRNSYANNGAAVKQGSGSFFDEIS